MPIMPCLSCFGKNQERLIGDQTVLVAAAEVKECTAVRPDQVLLFLGTGESGKSTFYRQLRILYGGGYDMQEMLDFGLVMHSMVISDACAIVQAMSNPQVKESLGDGQFSDSAQSAIQTISQWSFDSPKVLTPEIAELLYGFWRDPMIQKVFELHSLYHLSRQASFFFEKVKDMAKPNWVPGDEDLINFRVRTTGVMDQNIVLNGTDFRVVDVGGQRSERRKWIKHFVDVSIVLFVVAISEYDQGTWENESVNQLDDSLRVFEEICGTAELKKASIIILFNKTDLFRTRLERVSFASAVKGYTGDGSFDSCLDYLKTTYEKIAATAFAKLGRPERRVSSHFTTAIDPSSVKKVFQDVTAQILANRSNAINSDSKGT